MLKTFWAWIRGLWWTIPFLVIVALFYAFFKEQIPGLPKSLSDRGQFGDID